MTNEQDKTSILKKGLDALKPAYKKMVFRAWVTNVTEQAVGKNINFKNAKREVVSLLNYMEDPHSYAWMKNAKICRNPGYRNRLLCEFFCEHPQSKARIDQLINDVKHHRSIIIE